MFNMNSSLLNEFNNNNIIELKLRDQINKHFLLY